MNILDVRVNMFFTRMDAEMPGLCQRSGITCWYSDVVDYCKLVFRPKRPFHFDKVLGKFEDDPCHEILYHRAAGEGLNGRKSACVYKYEQCPGGHWLYILNFEAGDDGVIVKVIARIYNDPELYVWDLRLEAEEQKKIGGVYTLNPLSREFMMLLV